MADEAPSWLNDDAPTATSPAPASDAAGEPAPGAFSLGSPDAEANSDPTPAASGPATGSGGGGLDASALPEEEKDLPKVILIMRLANMGVSIVLVACSIITMLTLPSPATWVLAIYASCGGLLVCCLETQLKFLRVIIAMNFGFLFSYFYRFLFYLILGTVCWAYNSIFGKATGICMVAVAVFNTYVLIRYPSYRKMRDKIAEEEDKRIEARISREVKKQAIKGFTGSR
eukprot:CAMPEP_0183295922 /NCGR_PEP_ID=MMETSP0160_2-20130417/3690_1 /TAXON_ID=2839 ORGANISM="Odontella Sinensis, Strain Grunow 1884" /NCGR_SAMPLE_ID=MMETSP0160_2 /ASSEMBLY_ACC=CAM_ASM_000250 /LENGTH=228 /DNA_ID=CAMNT_0025457463 /DNA_START=62 /DNA_END=748 /DNA_ORIENTATION=+